MTTWIVLLVAIAFPATVAVVKFWRSFIPAPSRRWVNQSGLTDGQLDTIWGSAQQRLSTQPILINAVAAHRTGVPQEFLPPDFLATEISPRNVKVIAEDKLSVANANGYTIYGNTNWPEVHMLTKYVYPNDTAANDGAIGWEFENVIIWKLGYDVSGR